MSEMTLIYKEQKSEYNTAVYKNYSEITDKPEFDIRQSFLDASANMEIVHNVGQFKLDKYLYDEESFVENFANPHAKPHVVRRTIVIEENENKVALKVYTFNKLRGLTKKFFKVRKNITYLTFNFKRKQFFMGELNTKNKKKINQTLKINLPDLSMSSLISKLTISRVGFDRSSTYEESNGIYILQKFLDHVIDRLEIDVDKNQKAQKKYYEIILKLQKIKYPDAFEKFSSVFQPIKEVRTSDSNLVTFFMKKSGLKGKKARLLLNKYENLDIDSMISVQAWFGVDVFNRIKNESFLTKRQYSTWNLTPYFGHRTIDNVSKKEMDNIIDIINTSTTEVCLHTIMDHLSFQKELKKYGEDLKIESNNYDDFVFEHSEVSALLQSYRTGYVERYYGDDSKLVEDQIYSNEYTFFPKLLKNTNEYEEESAHQHNCVRTYIEKPYCFIISLRKENKNGNERATLEYTFDLNGVKRVQSRGKYNKMLSNEWDEPMVELDKYVNYLYVNEFLKLPKMTKKYKNGKTFTSNAIFPNQENKKGKVINMYPVWDDKNIENNNTINFYHEPIYDFDDLP